MPSTLEYARAPNHAAGRLAGGLLDRKLLQAATYTEVAMRFLAFALLLVIPGLVRADETGTGYPPPAQVKAAFLKLLDRPKVDADVKSDGPKKTADGFILEHLTFASEKKA